MTVNRRQMLRGMSFFGGLVLAKGCSRLDSSPSASAQSPSSANLAQSDPSVLNTDTACVLYPEQTEGPYYLDLNLLRQDITEGKAGVPLRLVLNVTDFPGCTPIANAAVDIWHCDALGVYAGYGASSQGETFLRGTQVTNPEGQVEFLTLYPGWYRGRTTHIHLKIQLDAETLLTSQIYFPDDITDQVYTRSPYSSRPARDTTNRNDGIFARGGNPEVVLLNLSESAEGYVGHLTIGAHRDR